MIILFLLVAVYSPASPTVGDVITIDLAPRQGAIIHGASTDYEVVAVEGTKLRVRTFEARPITVHGFIGGEPFAETIPVRSVLGPGDKLQPAALEPPKAQDAPRLPLWLILISGAVTAATWALVFWRARRTVAHVETEEAAIPPRVRFISAVNALRASRGGLRWAGLADATRRYLAAASPDLGADLTTSELLRRLGERERSLIERILRQGDIEKFAPWPPAAVDFELLATAALEIADWFEPHQEAQVAA